MTLRFGFKNKKGVALTYAVLVLFILATVMVAITALSSSTYNDAILIASDDQSYYYAKSIGLAIKEQFAAGQNIPAIIETLNSQETTYNDYGYVPTGVKGRYYVETADGDELVEGNVVVSYLRDDEGALVSDRILEVRVSCVYNNAVSVVTSLFTCEDDSEESKVSEGLKKYDVILTNKDDLNFEFANSSGVGTIDYNIFVYVGEDDSVVNPTFYLSYDMSGTLTTTGATTLWGGSATAYATKNLKGNLTGYGDLTLDHVIVQGSNGVHSAGNVDIRAGSYVATVSGSTYDPNSVYAHGNITLNAETFLHNKGITTKGKVTYGSNWERPQANNLVAHGNVTMNACSYIKGSIYAGGTVRVVGQPKSNAYNAHVWNTWVEKDIYASGNVTISNGAVVYGNVYSAGNVSITNGAIVYGNVEAKGDVTVNAGVVGGKVTCANKLYMYSSANYGNWLAGKATLTEYGVGSYELLFGGIGLFRGIDSNHSSDKIVHSCGSLQLNSNDCMVKVLGDLYVAGGTKVYGIEDYTILTSIWMPSDTLYLKGSRAIFCTANTQANLMSQAQPGKPYNNPYNNPNVWIYRLRQKQDFYFSEDDPYVKMYGAYIGTLEAGDKGNYGEDIDGGPRDVYAMDGTIGTALYARRAELKRMNLGYSMNEAGSADASIEAFTIDVKTYLRIYGDGSNVPASWAQATATRTATTILTNATINVACEKEEGAPVVPNDGSIGLYIGEYVKVETNVTVKVGTSSAKKNGTVILGDTEHKSGTEFYGTIHANVKDFILEGKTTLGTYRGGKVAVLNVQASGSFTVQPDAGWSGYRYSESNVRGNMNIQGTIWTVNHFSGNLSFGSSGKIGGTYWSESNGTLKFHGTFGSIEAANEACTVVLDGALTVTNLRVNGTFNNDGSYRLTVTKDLYIGKLPSGSSELKNVAVTGNVVVDGMADGSAFTVSANSTIGKTLICEKSEVTLSSATVGGVSAKKLTLKSGATLGGNNAKTLVKGHFKMEGGTLKSCNVECESFEQTGGTVTSVNLYATGSASVTDIVIKGGSGSSSKFYAPNGSFNMTGGKYTGSSTVQVKSKATVQATFAGSVTVTGGNLFVGGNGSTEYAVGTSGALFYASGTVTWKTPAKAPPDNTGSGISVAAEGDVEIGKEAPVKGVFKRITSLNGKVEFYGEKVDEGIYASKNVTVNVSGSFGSAVNASTGIRSGGKIEIGATAKTVTYKGTYVSSGIFTVSSALTMIANVKCSDASGIEKIREDKYSSVTKKSGARLSLQITGSSTSRFTLPISLSAGDGIEGSITTANRGLTITSGKEVEGIIYVNGIYYYGSSSKEIHSFGGVYCKNEDVSTKYLRGDLDLPNVTSIGLSGSINNLKADKITEIEFESNFDGSLNVPSITLLKVPSGITVGGTLVISDSGTLENYGTIKGGVQCGTYVGEGGTINETLYTKSSSTSTIDGGNVKGNIYCLGPLEVKNATSFGKSGGYIYSQKGMTFTNVSFNTGLDYIMSTGGTLMFDECQNIPNVRNTSGAIEFKNDSGHATTIKSVWSTGTNVKFGTGTTDNYQTVSGKMEWGKATNGSRTAGGKVYTYSTNTVFSGEAVFAGSGNLTVMAKFNKEAFFYNSGSLTIENSAFGGDLLCYNSGTLTMKTNVTVAGSTYINEYKSSGNVVRVTNVSITSSTAVFTGKVYFYSAGYTLTTKGTYNGGLRVDNAHVYMTEGGTIASGGLLHTASGTGYVVKIGTLSKRITISGDITVRGTFYDNSCNYGTINVCGYYYGDKKKEYDHCTGINVTLDGGAGWTWIFARSTAETMPGGINAQGWLFIYSHTSNVSNDKKFTISGTVRCNALTINTFNYGNAGGFGDYIGSYIGRNNNEMDVNTVNGLLPTNNETSAGAWCDWKTSTKKDRIILGEVYVSAGNSCKGVVAAANTRFKHLETDGQVCLSYCYMTSKNFNDDSYTSNGQHVGNTKKVASDGSLFGHGKNDGTGNNYLWNVNTKSNVSLFYGKTYMNGECCLEGVTSAASGGGMDGNVATKLYYFGQGLEMYGAATRISSALNTSGVKKEDSKRAPSARTIVWVAGGDLIVGAGAYIGLSTKSGLSRPGNTAQPGIYVSAGNAHIYGTVTIDLYVKKTLTVYSGGTVAEDDDTYKSWGKTYRYNIGLYITGGSITENSGGWFSLYHAESGTGRPYYTGRSSWSFAPDSSDIVSFVTGSSTDIKLSGTTVQKNQDYYKPKSSPYSLSQPSVTAATKFVASGRSSSENGNKNSDKTTTITDYSAPSVPALSASGNIGTSTASVSPLNISSSLSALSKVDYTVAGVTIDTVQKATTGKTFSPTYASSWTGGNYYFEEKWANNPGKVTYVRLADKWSDTKIGSYTIESHMNKLNDAVWNPRVIPYTWQLPTTYTSGGSTVTSQANRTLVGRTLSVRTSSPDYFELSKTMSATNNTNRITENLYKNSSSTGLKAYGEGGQLLNDRKKGGGSELYDYIRGQYDSDSNTDVDPERLTYLLVFESGRLPMSAFYDSENDDYTAWSAKGAGDGSDYFLNRYMYQIAIASYIPSATPYRSRIISYIENNLGHTAQYKTEFFAAHPDINKDNANYHTIPYRMFRKTIGSGLQKAWYWGSEQYRTTFDWDWSFSLSDGLDVDFDLGIDKENKHHINWIFYACEDPSKPYDSAAKDLHVILPEGLGIEFLRDFKNKLLILGRGRVFLYLTSGDTIYFRGDSNLEGIGGHKHGEWAIGSLTNRNADGSYISSSDHNVCRPQLYLIGAGTNVDLLIGDINLMAYIYMPYGTSSELYNSSTGKLKSENTVTNVNRNAFTYSITGDAGTGNERYIYGTITADNFYVAGKTQTNMKYKRVSVGPDFSETTIYGKSTYSGSTTKRSTSKNKVSLTSFMIEPPGFSTAMLNWKYVGMKGVQ